MTETIHLEQQLATIVKEIEGIEITTNEELKQATDWLTRANIWVKKKENERLEITAPLNQSLKQINDRYREPKAMVDRFIKDIRTKMGAYQQRVIEEQRAAEEKISGRIGEGRGHLKMETALRKMDDVEKAEKKIVGAGGEGSVTFIEVEKFEVVDVTKLPANYILADEVGIRAAMKDGLHLDGVRYWKEQQVRNNKI